VTGVAEATAPSPPARRSPGRPRSERAEKAILDATLALLAEHGVEGFSMEAVAARAGVGKATIYRRWSRKEALIVHALARLTEIARPPASGNLRDDLVAHVDLLRRRTTDPVAGRILPRVLSVAADHQEISDLYKQYVVTPRVERIAELLRRAQTSGELPADLDVALTVDMLTGPVLARKWLPLTGSRPLTRAQLERIVDTVLAGITAPRD
jgi:AcrR family transcriptional regulator